MAARSNSFTFLDENSHQATNTIHIAEADATLGDATRIALRDAIQAATSASLYKEAVILDEVVAAALPAVDAEYSIFDRAILSFKTAEGTDVRISIPAPKPSIFIGDDQVNELDIDVAAAIVALKASATDKSGNLVQTFTGGWRDRRTRGR